MSRKPWSTMVGLMLVVASNLASAQSDSANDSSPKPAAPTKKAVELFCEGKLRVFTLLPDGSEREFGSERNHDITLRVTDQKAFRNLEDDNSAIQIRFEDTKSCLLRTDGAACFRQVDSPEGKRMSTKDHLDVNRFNGKMVYQHERLFSDPVKQGEDNISGVRLEYSGKCQRASMSRSEDKPAIPDKAAAPEGKN